MFSGRQNISYYSRDNVIIWMMMAFQAGALNIGGMMACHSFVSHTTGYATIFGMTLVEVHDALPLLKVASIPIFFLLGSMLSGVFVDLRIQTHRTPKYYVVFAVMCFILLGVIIAAEHGSFGEFGEPLKLKRDFALIGLLCLACGLQNGAITSVSKAVVRTTHLTGITTDLGIGLVRILSGKKHQRHWPDEWKANFMRVGIILFFITGSATGAFFFLHYQFLGFILPLVTALYLASVATFSQVFKHRSELGN
jgi:uncharacterized membrane protein YoaK (UPF0700 family)